jgi:hypothetical protein
VATLGMEAVISDAFARPLAAPRHRTYRTSPTDYPWCLMMLGSALRNCHACYGSILDPIAVRVCHFVCVRCYRTCQQGGSCTDFDFVCWEDPLEVRSPNATPPLTTPLPEIPPVTIPLTNVPLSSRADWLDWSPPRHSTITCGASAWRLGGP